MIGLYVRVSTAEQAEKGYSIGEQTERLENYCAAMGWTVHKVYADPGYSGSSIDRPGLQSLIHDIKAGIVEKVVVYKLDRLSRSQLDTLYLIEKVFIANGADFISLSENFDTGSPFGRAMIGILAVFAQLEREQIKERMSMGKVARAKKGKFAGGKIPIGYDYIDGTFVPNEFEKILISEIFTMFASGISPKKIAKDLNDRGLQHRRGKWNDMTIRQILRNKTYCGYTRFREEYQKGSHEPIISEDLFDQVQRIMNRRTEMYNAVNARPGRATSYLAGLLECGCCGAKYAKHKQTVRNKDGSRVEYCYYSCNSRTKVNRYVIKDPGCKNRHIRMKDLDDIIFAEIKKLALDPSYVAEIRTAAPDSDRIPTLRNEIKKLDNQIGKLVDLYAVGNVPVDVLQQRIDALNSQRSALSTELESIQTADDERISNAETVRIAASFADVLDRGNIDEIRQILFSLINKIVIDPEDITIFWNFA